VALAGDALMARPGDRAGASRDVMRGMAQKAHDLQAPVPEAMQEKVRVGAEKQLGMRCGGCGRRIGVGLQFTRIDVVRGQGGVPQADVMKLSACNGADGCDFAEEARKGADVIEMIEYVWLNGEEPVGTGSLEGDVEAAERAAGDGGPAE
jgi:hypothetical protein